MGVIPARSIKSDVFSKPFPFYYFFTRAKFDKPLNRRAIIAGVDDRWTGFYVRWIARAWVIFMLVFVFIIGLKGMFQDPPDDYYNVVVERACAECRLPDACPIATEVEGEDLAMCEGVQQAPLWLWRRGQRDGPWFLQLCLSGSGARQRACMLPCAGHVHDHEGRHGVEGCGSHPVGVG